MPDDNTTVGLEIEFQGVSREALQDFNFLEYDIHDDGSTRGPTYNINNDIAIVPQQIDNRTVLCEGMREARTIGLELVTRPLSYTLMKKRVSLLQEYLLFTPQTPRTSIHVHVDISGVSWKEIRNIILWSYYLEAPLFRLSCGGLIHRGERTYLNNRIGRNEYNDFKYARPLSSPIGCFWSGEKNSLINLDCLLNAEYASEFLSHWGRCDLFWSGARETTHYIGHRLHMVNILSAMRYGTLEWRLFDALYGKIELFLDIVMAMHRLGASGKLPDFEPMILGGSYNVSSLTISHILDLDVSSLWGSKWPKGCKQRYRDPHYGEIHIPNAKETPIQVYRHDSGKYTDPLFVRGL